MGMLSFQFPAHLRNQRDTAFDKEIQGGERNDEGFKYS
jgi:hypothetical protein